MNETDSPKAETKELMHRIEAKEAERHKGNAEKARTAVDRLFPNCNFELLVFPPAKSRALPPRPRTNPAFSRRVQLVKKNHSAGDVLSRIDWHPAFVEALGMELKAYMDILEFHTENRLTAEPLRIDCVVIKKAKGVTIDKNIAAIFRGTNLLEYKSRPIT